MSVLITPLDLVNFGSDTKITSISDSDVAVVLVGDFITCVRFDSLQRLVSIGYLR